METGTFVIALVTLCVVIICSAVGLGYKIGQGFTSLKDEVTALKKAVEAMPAQIAKAVEEHRKECLNYKPLAQLQALNGTGPHKVIE